MRQRGINVSSFAHRKEPEADSRCRQMAGLCLTGRCTDRLGPCEGYCPDLGPST
jgi:hypothetical protein